MPQASTEPTEIKMNTHSNILLPASLFMATALLLAGCGKEPAPATIPATAETSAANVADIDVTTNVRTALGQDPALKGFDIGVVTLKGDVRLTGILNEQSQIDEALKIARTAAGAHSVHDELTLKK